jgi:ABC-type phosphate transport system auxiliary subunit
MSSKVEELQARVIELQLELRRLEAKRRRLKKKIDSELDRLLRAKEILKRSHRIHI